MVNDYIPKRGDIVWLDFNPKRGREQAGKRPALVLSEEIYNRRGLGIFLPITSKVKGYPFEVEISTNEIGGAILSDHIKYLDWRMRNIKYIGKAKSEDVENALKKLLVIINKKV